MENMNEVKYTAHSGETAFISACIDGKLEIAKSLFSQGGVDLNARTNGDTTVLEEIVFKTANRPANFMLTMHEGREVSITDPEEIRRILGSHPDDEFRTYLNIVLFVLENGADPDSLNKNGQSALFTAAGEGAEWMVALLAAHGATLDLRDNWDLTALHFGCRMGYPEVAKILLKEGASIDLQDDYGFTPAFEAAAGRFVPVLEILAEYGADFGKGLTRAFKTNPEGTTPLQYAKKHGFQDVVEFLEKTTKAPRQVKQNVETNKWKWNENAMGHEGVQIKDGRLLWYTHREDQHSPSIGASFQEFGDFLEKGPDVSNVPQQIINEIVSWITE